VRQGIRRPLPVALGVADRREKIDTSASEVTCPVGVGPAGDARGLQVEIEVAIPGIEPDMVPKLVVDDRSGVSLLHATRDNMPVTVIAART
jgi:lipoyl-dependent peroxiredoxin